MYRDHRAARAQPSFVVLTLLALATITGCGSQPPTPIATAATVEQPSAGPPSSGPSGAAQVEATAAATSGAPPAADVQAASDLIARANLADKSSLDAIGGQLLFSNAGAAAARQALDHGAQGDALWAALWVYASAGSDPAPVEKYIADADPSIRALAAVTLIAFGDRSGFDAAASLLADSEGMSGSEPPMSIATYVLGGIAANIDSPSAPAVDENDVATGAQSWAAWLAANGSSLTYDAQRAVWTAP